MTNQFLNPIWDAFENFADRTAVTDRGGTRQTTYRELGEKVKKIAGAIHAKGLPPHSFIPIVMDASADYLAAELGIWMAGHAFVPLGTTFPKERIDYICNLTEAPIVATEETIEVWLEEDKSFEVTGKIPMNEKSFMIFTSGSTGVPKGILHTFDSLLYFHDNNTPLKNQHGVVWGSAAPFYFIASPWSHFELLRNGCHIHLYDEETKTDVKKMERYMTEFGITHTFMSPSVLKNFHNSSNALKCVFVGSEKVTGEKSREGFELINAYGLSETLAGFLYYPVTEIFQDATPVGKTLPYSTTECRLVDEEDNEVPDGDIGELVVRGVFTEGYYKEKEKTNDLYRNGWLHTGDLMKKDCHGNFIYVNRKDWMVKINGQRVEPGEVETVFKSIPEIKDAIVKGFEGTNGKSFLCGFYISDKELNEESIKKELAKKLPEYMIPAHIVRMDKFPLLPNGKTDRKSLQPPTSGSLQADYVAPTNPKEDLLTNAFSKIFNLEKCGIDDDFFKLGGDSINVMRLQQMCPELNLSTKMIYKNRTPRKIAGECEIYIADDKNSGNKKETKTEKPHPVPLTETQTGIYIESMGRKGEVVYNIPLLLRLNQDIDTEKLARSIEKLVELHPFLKTRIVEDEKGNPLLTPTDYVYSQNVENLREDDFNSLIPELIQPFDLHNDQLFRIKIIQTEKAPYMFLDFHHVIFDGGSFRIFMEELNKLYDGEILTKEEWTGYNVAEEEQRLRSSKIYEEAKKWYEDNFFSLDIDSKPLPDRKDEKTIFRSAQLPTGITENLVKEVCNKYSITPNVLTIGAFGKVLGTYCNLQESLFATIYNGRDSVKTSRTIDMLVKTLPVHCNWKEDMTVEEYLTNVKEQLIGSMTNDIYSFAEIASSTDINSDILFAYQGDYLSFEKICGYPYERMKLETNSTGSAINFQIFEKDGEIILDVEYKGNLYSDEFIDGLMKCYRSVLSSMLRAERMFEIEVTEESQIKELDSFNNTEVDYDKEETVTSLFEKAAILYPENIAVTYEDRKYTYKELSALSRKIACHLLSKGIKQGDVVSILIPRSEWMVIASLGSLMSGAAYQPLDSTYPPERLNFMIKDSDAKLLITTSELRPIVNEYEGEVLFINEIDSLEECDNIPDNIKPSDLFTLLYTSGSTGLPKGVKLTHGNLVCFIEWYTRYFSLQPEDCVGAYASYGFDANMMDMYPALAKGATVCIIPEDLRLDMESLNRYMVKNHITHQFMTTQVGRQFASDITETSLRYLSMGGEKLLPFPIPDTYKTYNGYGPTECTIFSTIYELKKGEKDIPIGKALDNLKCYVVSTEGKRVPKGALGELWIAGPHVADGYLNRPDKTAEVFIKNPFDDGDYTALYRSGDIVRYMNDGNIEFIGRRDGQVKIRGFRIELSEVESVVREFPGIKDATVAAFDHPSGGKFITAYIVSESKIDPSEISAFISERKPPYMVPSVIMQIDSIPLNQNHKVNKRALPVPEFNVSEQVEDSNRPANLLEEEIKGIVADVLGHSEIGLTVALINYGLTSILSIKLASALFKRFGIEIPSKTLLKGASIESIENIILKNFLDGSLKGEKPSEPIKETQISGSEGDLYPLSFPQTGVYFDSMKHPGEVMYNIPSLLSFSKEVSAEKIADALQKVFRAHPGLTTRIKLTENGVMQQIVPEEDIKINQLNLKEDELKDFRKSFVKPFRFSDEPLYRFSIVTTENGVNLFMDFHHLIFDGGSLDIFIKQLADAISGTYPSSENYTYQNYVEEEQEFEKSQAFEENKAFYADLLADLESASEITANINNKVDEGKMKMSSSSFDFNEIDKLAKAIGVTSAAVMLAATFYTVARFTNDKNVFLSTISSGRSNLKISDTVGMFVNTLPLGIKIEDETIEAFIRKTASVFQGVLEHEKYPFARIAADFGFEPSIVYEYQLGVINDKNITGLKKFEGLELDIAKFKLSVHIEEVEGKPSVAVYYNDALYSVDLAQNISKSIVIAAEGMAKEPKKKISGLSLLDKDREKLLQNFHTVAEATPVYSYFHEGLEHQAEINSGKTALIAEDGSFTYSELNKFSNRIANSLLSLGVEPRSKVVLLLPRTSRMIMSMFGVMKAGSAYIPCDPEYPVERISHIITDSEAPFIITTADRLSDFHNAIDVENLLKGSDEKPVVNITPKDLAYLIYTSGSTGKPKGVMLRHESIANYLTPNPGNRHIFAVANDADCYLSITTVSFDMSLKEIGAALFNGLTLVFANEEQTTNPISLAKLFKETKADAFNTTPSRMLQFMELEAFREALGQCKVIMCGGEKYADGLLDKLRVTAPEARIFNTYGPTEITVSSNAKELTESNQVNIGKPLLNVTEFIVDKDGNELPPGIVGELYIGGMGVATGYNRLPEMTEERFIDYDGLRIYKSGDYARWNQEGEVEILGRTDNQIKLRGLRIEIGEVEAALASVNGIKNAVVKIGKIKGEEHLCAYFTADRQIDIPELKKELGKSLTKYMVPTAYLQLEKMPITPNGKTDLKALPEPQLSISREYEAPVNETEQAIADIFARILKLDKVGATDNFYEIGGTSLLTTRVIIETDKAGYTVAYGDIFKYPTPRELADFILGKKTSENKEDEAADFDYTEINRILKENTLERFINGDKQKTGDVLLTGATGFLGIHILKELIDSNSGDIYCLVRGKTPEDGEMRLKTLLFYYFDNSFEELFGKRIHIIPGDVTSEIDSSIKVDTLINSAAVVKHFAEGTEIEDVNIGGARHCIDYCLKTGAQMIQISTASTRGLSVNGVPAPGMVFNEQKLYIGQFLGNKYIYSKFIAERMVLEAIATQGLRGKIMRVGNLSARSTDGEFQANFRTNSFMGRLKVYNMLGCCPYESRDGQVEFSPINEVAKAIVLLTSSPKENIVFHPYNNHFVLLGDVLSELSMIGDGIKFVEMEEFSKAMEKAKEDPAKAQILSSMLAYQNMANGQKSSDVIRQNAFTMQVLYRLGYKWSVTSWDYVDRFFKAINGLGFFDD